MTRVWLLFGAVLCLHDELIMAKTEVGTVRSRRKRGCGCNSCGCGGRGGGGGGRWNGNNNNNNGWGNNNNGGGGGGNGGGGNGGGNRGGGAGSRAGGALNLGSLGSLGGLGSLGSLGGAGGAGDLNAALLALGGLGGNGHGSAGGGGALDILGLGGLEGLGGLGGLATGILVDPLTGTIVDPLASRRKTFLSSLLPEPRERPDTSFDNVKSEIAERVLQKLENLELQKTRDELETAREQKKRPPIKPIKTLQLDSPCDDSSECIEGSECRRSGGHKSCQCIVPRINKEGRCVSWHNG